MKRDRAADAARSTNRSSAPSPTRRDPRPDPRLDPRPARAPRNRARRPRPSGGPAGRASTRSLLDVTLGRDPRLGRELLPRPLGDISSDIVRSSLVWTLTLDSELQDRAQGQKSSLSPFISASRSEMLSAVTGVAQRLRDSASAFASVGRNANLRWLELAWAASILRAFRVPDCGVRVRVQRRRRERGGLIFLARLIPAALIAPFAGMLGDRYPRERVLLFTNLTRIVLVSAAAVAVFADASSWLIYALSIARDDRYDSVPVFPGGANAEPGSNAAGTHRRKRRLQRHREHRVCLPGPALAGLLLAVASTGARIPDHGPAHRRFGWLPHPHPHRALRATPP